MRLSQLELEWVNWNSHKGGVMDSQAIDRVADRSKILADERKLRELSGVLDRLIVLDQERLLLFSQVLQNVRFLDEIPKTLNAKLDLILRY